MANLSTEEALLEAVTHYPGETAGTICRRVGMDRSNTRRDLKKLCRDGKMIGQDTGNDYVFFPVGDQTGQRFLSHTEPAHQSPIIELGPDDFTDTTDSRLAPQQASPGGVVIHQPPGRRGPSGGAVWQNTPGAAAIPINAFDIDPDGSLTASAMSYQETAGVRYELAQLRAELEQDRQRTAAEAAAREQARQKAERDEMLGAVLRWSTKPAADDEDVKEKPAPSLLQQAREARENRRLEAEELNEERFQESLRRQKRRFPEDQFPELYEHLNKPAPAPRTRQKPVTELLSHHSDSPPVAGKWRAFALAAAAVAAFVCVLKFAGSLAA